MSWFTADKDTTGSCPRCKSPQFVVLVKRAGAFDILNCRNCELPPQKKAAS